MLRRIGAMVSGALLLTLTMLSPAHASSGWSPPSGGAGILIDSATSQVLWQQAADERLAIASTTKIMTAILAIESGRLDEAVTIPPEAEQVDGSKVFLTHGTTYTLRQLVEALVLESANDAAVAIALFLDESEAAFAARMTAKARSWGLMNTQFRNAHGLDEEGHFSSARDLAVIGQKAMANPIYREIAGADELPFPWPERETTREIHNRNLLVHQMPEATGVKNGFTEEALHTLVGAAQAGGREVIGVLLANPEKEQMYTEMERLLRHGLYDFQLHTVVPAGELAGFEGRLNAPLQALLQEGERAEVTSRQPLPGEVWPDGTMAIAQAIVGDRVVAEQAVLPKAAPVEARPQPADRHEFHWIDRSLPWYEHAGLWMAAGALLYGLVSFGEQWMKRRKRWRTRKKGAARGAR